MDAMNAKIVTALEDARWMDSLCEFMKKMLKEEWISEEKRKFLINSLAENEEKTIKLKEKVVDLLYEKNSLGYIDPSKDAANPLHVKIPLENDNEPFDNPGEEFLSKKTERDEDVDPLSELFLNHLDSSDI